MTKFGTWKSRRRPLLAIALISSLSNIIAAAAPIQLIGTQLTEATWDERLKDGLYFVEHFSPFCGHCKRFAPTWRELVDSAAEKSWETRGLHLAQVDCISQGDLCLRLEVKYYPFLRLYENGKPLEAYDGDRSLAKLQQYLDEKSADYMSHHPMPPPPPPPPADPVHQKDAAAAAVAAAAAADQPVKQSEQVVIQPAEAHLEVKKEETAAVALEGQDRPKEASGPVPGPDGEVITLTKETWTNYTSVDSNRGPTFIIYFAPWCPHCRSLKPVWKDLAHMLRGQVNVAEFNCDDSDKKPICIGEGVRGYPTLTFYHDGSRVDYRGARSLTQMEHFARKAAAASGVRDISPQEINQAIADDEVFFLLLYTPSTPKELVFAVHAAAKSFLGSVTVFKSDSFDLFDRFSIPHASPSLLVFKDYDTQPFSHIPLEPNAARAGEIEQQVKTWVRANKLPVLAEMTSGIFDDVMKERARKLVVIGPISTERSGKEEAAKLKEGLKAMAKQWKKSPEARGVATRVDWLWVDADLWSSWLHSMYGIKPSASPPVIIADPFHDEYYDAQANGEPTAWAAASVFQTLLAIEEKKVQPKSTRSALEAIVHALDRANDAFTGFMFGHPWAFALALLALGAGAVRLLLCLSEPDARAGLLVDRNRALRHQAGFSYKPPAAKAD